MVRDIGLQLDQLRAACVGSKPGARLAAVRQRLARVEDEGDAVRLVTIVSAVESLARSLVVHAPNRPAATAHIRYDHVRGQGPLELVEETLRLYGGGAPAEQFGAETWTRFEYAHQFRHLLVHECTHASAGTYDALIAASESVLEGLVQVAGLLRVVA